MVPLAEAQAAGPTPATPRNPMLADCRRRLRLHCAVLLLCEP